jgi:hypothetical protein
VTNNNQSNNQSNNQKMPGNVNKNRRVRMVGKVQYLSPSHNTNCKISAASKLYKKAVFCVDNVQKSCSTSDLETFVTSLGVTVISCFAVDSRKRRNESAEKYSERQAFRLCVPVENVDKLLDPTNWPESIVIHDWYFKKPSSDQTAAVNERSKRQKLNTPLSPLLSRSAAASLTTQVEIHVNNDDSTNSDDTVIMVTDHSQDTTSDIQ